MLGLTLAHRLAAAGQQRHRARSGARVGGLAAAWQLGDVTWDRHYHVTLLSDSHLRGAARASWASKTTCGGSKPSTGFYTDGRLHSMSNTLEFLRFPPLRLVDKLRLGADDLRRLAHRKNWRPLERVLVADWLRNGRASGRSRRSGCRCCRPSSARATARRRRRSSGPRSRGCTPPGAPGSRRRCSATSAAATPACCSGSPKCCKPRASSCARTAACAKSIAQPDGHGARRTSRGAQRLRPRRAHRRRRRSIADVCPQLTADERRRHEAHPSISASSAPRCC